MLNYFISFFILVPFITFAYSMNNMLNKPFMDQQGKTLSGEKIYLPFYFNNRVTFVAFGFSRKCQDDFDSWLVPFKEKYDLNRNVFFLEIPMLGAKLKWGKFFLEKAMKSGIKPSNYDNIMNYYGDTTKYKDYYGFTEKDKGYFFLVDQQSQIIWQDSGASDLNKINELFNIIDNEIKRKVTDG